MESPLRNPPNPFNPQHPDPPHIPGAWRVLTCVFTEAPLCERDVHGTLMAGMKNECMEQGKKPRAGKRWRPGRQLARKIGTDGHADKGKMRIPVEVDCKYQLEIYRGKVLYSYRLLLHKETDEI